MSARRADGDAGLQRAIGRWDLVALLINGIVGAGIFGLPARVHALLGPWALPAYLACAGLVLLVVLCFAEVASRFDGTGGPYLYARTAFGRGLGFQVGWLAWLSRLTAFAALCHLFADYAAHFLPALEGGVARALLLASLILALAAINWVGVRRAVLAGDAFTVAKLVPLLLFVALGLFHLAPAQLLPTTATMPSAADASAAILLLVFAFTGFESAVVPAGEARDPRRDLPFGLLAALAIVTPLYLAIHAVCAAVLPDLAQSARPVADAAERFLGRAGTSLIVAGALVSILGTLHGILLAAPRMLYAMAGQGDLPRALAAVHPRFHTPHRAIALTAAVLLLLTLGGSFLAAVTLSTVARLGVYLATCSAVPALRRRVDVAPPRFRLRAGNVLAAAALGLLLWLLLHASWRDLVQVGIAVAAGALLLWASGRGAVRG